MPSPHGGRRYPNANVAIATGAISGLVVIDIDGPDGEASLATLPPMPETRIVQTGRGRHLYFAHPGGAVPNSAGKLGKGIDVRGDSGYVVAPPSRHLIRPYEVIRGGELAVEPEASAKPGGLIVRAPIERATDALARASTYLAAIPGAVSGRGGHDQTLRAALHMKGLAFPRVRS